MRRLISFIAIVLVFTLCLGSFAFAEKDVPDRNAEQIEATEENLDEQPSTSQLLVDHGVPVIEDKETVQVEDVCEFSIDYTNVIKRVDPPRPVSYYVYFEAEAGEQYVDICISYKNLNTTDIMADKVGSAYVIYAGEYYYGTYIVIEEQSRGSLTYSNITPISPLTTEYLHFLASIPDEAAKSNGELIAVLDIGGQKCHCVVREGETGKLIQPSENAITEKDCELKLHDIAYIEDVCEISPESINIARDVYPAKPYDYCLYFTAGAGKQFIDLCVRYKSFTDRAVLADKLISATLTYNEKYNYNAFDIIEQDSRGTFSYNNITYVEPLTNDYLHYLFEVPDEVANSKEPITITLKVDSYSYTIAVNS